MFAVYVAALLGCMAVSHSAPLSCENLLQPSGPPDFEHLKGTWPLVAGSLGNATLMDLLENRDSVSMDFGDTSNSSAIPFIFAFNRNNTCHYHHTIIEIEGHHFILKSRGVSGALLKTSCDDCLLIDFGDATMEHRRLYLFSKKREMDLKQKEEFTAQAACLNMTSPVWKDPTKMLCPEKLPVEPTPEVMAMTVG